MGLFQNIFTPGYKNEDENIRLKAVERIKNPDLALELLKTETSRQVQYVLVGKIKNQDILASLVAAHPDIYVKERAFDAITDGDILYRLFITQMSPTESFQEKMASNAALWVNDAERFSLVMPKLVSLPGYTWENVIKHINDSKQLLDIALGEVPSQIQWMAGEKITDQDCLKVLVLKSDHNSLKQKMVPCIKDEAWLADNVSPDMEPGLQFAMIREIKSSDLLARFAGNQAFCYKVRKAVYNSQGFSFRDPSSPYFHEMIMDIAGNEDDLVDYAGYIEDIKKVDDDFWFQFISTLMENRLWLMEGGPWEISRRQNNILKIFETAVNRLKHNPDVLIKLYRNRQDRVMSVVENEIFKVLPRETLAELLERDDIHEISKNGIRHMIGQNAIEKVFCPQCKTEVMSEKLEQVYKTRSHKHAVDYETRCEFSGSDSGYVVYRCTQCGKRFRNDFDYNYNEHGELKDNYTLLPD